MEKAEYEHKGIREHLMKMAKEKPGDHMHIHGHEGGFTTHHIKEEDGEVEGPHEHASMRDLKRHVADTMDSDDDGDEG